MLLVILRVYTFWVDTQIYRLCRCVTVDYVGTEIQSPIFFSTFVPCSILILSKFYLFANLKNNIKICIKIYIKTAPVLK